MSCRLVFSRCVAVGVLLFPPYYHSRCCGNVQLSCMLLNVFYCWCAVFRFLLLLLWFLLLLLVGAIIVASVWCHCMSSLCVAPYFGALCRCCILYDVVVAILLLLVDEVRTLLVCVHIFIVCAQSAEAVPEGVLKMLGVGSRLTSLPAVTALALHPSNPAWLAIGYANGLIILWDFSRHR